MFKPIQTVISAWAATTVAGIDIGDLASRSKPIDARIDAINLSSLRNWLTTSLARASLLSLPEQSAY